MEIKMGVTVGSKNRKPWTSMKVVPMGKATELIKGGGGKLSSAGGDPGEGKKQSGGMG